MKVVAENVNHGGQPRAINEVIECSEGAAAVLVENKQAEPVK